jgi:hypothetical protein
MLHPESRNFMKQDRLLLGILGGIIVLIIISLVLFFARREEQAYGPDTNPEGIVRNYVLALHNGDYQRAYSYLQEAEYKPSLNDFRQDFISTTLDITNTGVQINAVSLNGDEAVVNLTIIHGGTEPFDRMWDDDNSAWLIQQQGQWKLSYFPYPYWGWNWYSKP